MANALPMSRTKWALNGPVSGTAAGRRAYQSAGAASIQAALARFTTPKMPNAQAQGSLRSECAIDPPRCAAPRGPRAAGGARRELLAQGGGQPGDAGVDRRRVEGGEAERDVIGAATTRVEEFAAPVRDAARPRRLLEAIRVDAGRQREPDQVAAVRLGPARSRGHLPAERREHGAEAGGIQAAQAAQVAVEAAGGEQGGECGLL